MVFRNISGCTLFPGIFLCRIIYFWKNEMSEKKLFLLAIAISTCIRIILATVVPITGDEAYFIIWAKHLSYGYYEHPPMIGWIMWLFSFLGENIFVYRLFPVFVVPLMAFLMVKVLHKIDQRKTYLCACAFLFSPVSILNVLSVNDVPLIFFTFLAGFFFLRALQKNRVIDAILSGFFGGCAFLSKYFFVLFFVSVLVFSIFSRRKDVWKILIISFVSGFPLVMINLVWNYNNCWLNIMFNLFFRNRDLSIRLSSVMIFLIEQIFLMTPFLAIIFIKKGFLYTQVRDDLKSQALWYFFIIPIGFFFILSFVKNIGLHWTASFYPFFFMLLIFLDGKILLSAIKYNFYLSTVILISVVVLVSMPVETFSTAKKYQQIVMFTKHNELHKEIVKELVGDIIPASTGYTEASVLSYYCKREFVLFGSMSRSGRYFDFITDFRKFDGKDFLIVSLSANDAERFRDFFQKISVEIRDIRGAKFYFIFGNHFIFKNYRDLYLEKILKLYYNCPSFLPARSNFFKERYFM